MMQKTAALAMIAALATTTVVDILKNENFEERVKEVHVFIFELQKRTSVLFSTEN